MIILKIFWLFLPAALANSSGTLFGKVKFLNTPVDFGKRINNQPIFGKNKTYRGFFFGTLVAVLVAYIQKTIYPYAWKISLINYSEKNFIIIGFLLGFGALFGDLAESFLKRRLKKEPGKPFIPFDQLDWIVSANLFIALYVNLSWNIVVLSLIIFGILHPLSNIIAYYLGIKDAKY